MPPSMISPITLVALLSGQEKLNREAAREGERLRRALRIHLRRSLSHCLPVKFFLLVALLLVGAVVPMAHAETVFVSNEKGNSIAVLDAKTLTVQKTIRVGQRPRGIVLSKDNKTLYILSLIHI